MKKFSTEEILKFMEERRGGRCPLGFFLLEYFISQDLLKTSESGGRLGGVLIFRKVKLSKFDKRDCMTHDKRGDCAHVLELCADSPEAIADVEAQMSERLGRCRHIAMTRRGRMYFYDYKKFMDKLLKRKG